MAMPSQPLSVAQIAESTNISRRTIQRAIAKLELKAHKLGDATSAYVVDPEDLQTWLATRESVAS